MPTMLPFLTQLFLLISSCLANISYRNAPVFNLNEYLLNSSLVESRSAPLLCDERLMEFAANMAVTYALQQVKDDSAAVNAWREELSLTRDVEIK